MIGQHGIGTCDHCVDRCASPKHFWGWYGGGCAFRTCLHGPNDRSARSCHPSSRVVLLMSVKRLWAHPPCLYCDTPEPTRLSEQARISSGVAQAYITWTSCGSPVGEAHGAISNQRADWGRNPAATRLGAFRGCNEEFSSWRSELALPSPFAFDLHQGRQGRRREAACGLHA
jgi:hypothetical protein